MDPKQMKDLIGRLQKLAKGGGIGAVGLGSVAMALYGLSKSLYTDESIQTADLLLQGYEEPFRRDRHNHGGGVMVYVKSGIIARRRHDLENQYDETIWLTVQLKGVALNICAIYRPETSRGDFWDRLENSIGNALEESPHLILNGDWNINFLNNIPTRINDMLLIYSLNNLITEPTRVSNNSATCIDPIFVSDEIENIESGVINTDNQLTDHFATYCSLNLISNVPQSFRRDVWLYNQANFDQLKNDLHNTEWGSILNDTDIDVVCQNFNNKLKEVVLKHIPKKSVIIRGNDRPWFNSTIRKEIRLRDRFRKKYISTKSQQHKYIYKQQRNKVNNLKKILKEKFIINLDDNIDEIKSRNPKLYWSIIRTLLKGTKPSQTLPPLNSENGLVFSDSEKCDLLNEYFCKISSLENDDKTPPSFDERTEIHVPNITVTEQEIKDIIDILDINKASGPDEFSHRLIKI
ncbi:hypothetical protein FSP39_011601 [Pinctada imbricata]|uniref:Endonuclease/exonuclease/phosphatase domain-containing protein n=1 Tax=Pinctada imbricata TaxID=66713 RepID=A0AA88YSJ4_PINIB|nr:hypothetical protein FSP39_011601 [Pinctada imbricata]